MVRRISSLLMVSLLAACGAEDVPAVVDEAPTQVEALQPTGLVDDLQLEIEDAPHRSFRPQPSLRAGLPVVTAHSLDVPDGTRVEFMLGVVGCGMMVVARDTVVVQGGRFEIPFDPASADGFENVSLYFRVVPAENAVCDETAQVMEATVSLPGSVDLSQAQQTYGGCWLFERP